ncbi:hypothetical protein FisN_38Lh004 [Fistulifera solaris]|uniref:EF-hand domain-containing protein n=1 Tax=Fistulifera solaris TaxID=1519565 RepID=A0A1Z5J6Q3_FISSO|nr:hypothetical protein FisN_38Lh004 [Fistulifera solaris]|eukprot:GAX09582.1 hypothetical protein FisN_38Lh004 [Fistulifera solaris]
MPSIMSFLGKKRKIPLCLLLLAQLSHAQYISCRETLTSANLDGDATLQAAEIPGFVFHLSSGIVDAASVDSLPVPLQTVFSSRANAINLLGISDPTAAAALLELETFCDDVYNALGEHLGIAITQNACIGALQTADTSPGNGRVSFEPEFLAFTTSLAGTDFGVTTAAELPAGLIRVFDDFSGGTDVKSSAGLEYLVQFCQRTALQAKIEVDKPDLPATTPPTPPPVASTSLPVPPLSTSPPVPPMVAPTLSPVAAAPISQPTAPAPVAVDSPIPQPTAPAPVAFDSPSPVEAPTSTGFVLTDEFYASCLTSMQSSDQNGNNLMESSEYPAFIDGILEGTYAETPFTELDPLFQTAFNEMAVVRDSINIFGAKPGESPDADQTSYLRKVCSAAGQADFDLNSDGGESTPVPAPAGSETTSPAPLAPVDGLVSPECQAAIDAGGSWSQDSYALFVQKLAPSLDGTFETLPYLLQDNYRWIMNGEDTIMIPDTPYGEAYSRFICDRTQRLIDQPEKGQTLEEQCVIALEIAASDGATLSQNEYVVFLNQISGFAWEGIQFDALDLLLRDVFEENEVEGKAVASSNDFCEAVSQALGATRAENAFHQQCIISLLAANTDLDNSLSTAEYAEVVSTLDGSTDAVAAFDDLSSDAKINYELFAEDNGVQVSGLLTPNRTQEDSESLRGLCDSIRAIINDPIDSRNATRVTVFNAFVLQNDLGFTQRDLETGVLRNTLESAYRNFVTAQVAKLVKPTGGRRKLSAIVLLDDTIRLYRIEDNQCPSGASGSCQRVYGSFDVEAAQDDSNLSSEYSSATQAAIDDGALQDEVTKLDPDFELVVFSSSEVLRPGEGVYPSASTGGKDKTVLVSVLTILSGALFGMLGAAAVAYYIVRKNLPAPGTETNPVKADPELALFDHFDTNDENNQTEAPTDDPYGHLALFNRKSRTTSTRDVSEQSRSEQSEEFERYAIDADEANQNFNFPASQATSDEQSDDEGSINSDAMFQKEENRWSNNSPIISPVNERGRKEEVDAQVTSPGQNQFSYEKEDHLDDNDDDPYHMDLQPLQYGALRQPSSPSYEQVGAQQEELDQVESLNASAFNSEYDLQNLEDDIQNDNTMQMAPPHDSDEEYSVEVQEEFSEEVQNEEFSEEFQEEEFSEEIVEEMVSESEVDVEDIDEEGESEDERSALADDADLEGESEEDDCEEEKSEHEESEETEDDGESDGDSENDNAEAPPPYRDEIAALMQQVMPDEMENLDAMLEQFSGREAELLETLENMVNTGSDDDYSEECEDGEEDDEDDEQEREVGSEEEEEEDESEEEEEEENTKSAESESEEEQEELVEESDAGESEGEETAAGESEGEESESEAATSEEEEYESDAAESEEEEEEEAASEEDSETEEIEEEESEEASESQSEEETEAPEASDSDDSDDSDSS